MTSRRVWKRVVAWIVVVASVCVVVSAVFVVPSAFAVSPAASPHPRIGQEPGAAEIVTDPHNPNAGVDPRRVALKFAFRINSGVKPGQPKGTVAIPYVTDAPQLPTPGLHAASTKGTSAARPTTIYPYSWPQGCTNCAELSIPSYVQNVWEPGCGYDPNPINPVCRRPNFGLNTPSYDDAQGSYLDTNYFNLCGPGAADVALWYWPAPPNTGNFYATDPQGGGQRYWKGKDPYDLVFRLRGYLVQLAFNIQPTGWNTAGMMQSGRTTTDSKMVDALNWEASNHNLQYQGWFYFIASAGGLSLHDAVSVDVVSNNVPTVVLLDANAALPNWSPGSGPPGTGTHHYITIVGYNDDTGEYAYMDTCGYSTHCNGYQGGDPGHFQNYDGGVKKVSQSAVWNSLQTWGEYFF